jgi:hypothetical protein
MTAMQVLLVCKQRILDAGWRSNHLWKLPPPPLTPPLLCEQDETNDRHTSLQTGPAPPRPVLRHRPAVSPADPVLRRPSSSALPSLASRLVAAVPPPPSSHGCMLSLGCRPFGLQFTCPSHYPSPPILCHPSPVCPAARLHIANALVSDG